jgi:hypothetical protein
MTLDGGFGLKKVWERIGRGLYMSRRTGQVLRMTAKEAAAANRRKT